MPSLCYMDRPNSLPEENGVTVLKIHLIGFSASAPSSRKLYGFPLPAPDKERERWCAPGMETLSASVKRKEPELSHTSSLVSSQACQREGRDGGRGCCGVNQTKWIKKGGAL